MEKLEKQQKELESLARKKRNMEKKVENAKAEAEKKAASTAQALDAQTRRKLNKLKAPVAEERSLSPIHNRDAEKAFINKMGYGKVPQQFPDVELHGQLFPLKHCEEYYQENAEIEAEEAEEARQRAGEKRAWLERKEAEEQDKARRALFIKNASPTSPRHKREADFEAQLEESIATRKGSALELLEKEKQKKAAKKAQVQAAAPARPADNEMQNAMQMQRDAMEQKRAKRAADMAKPLDKEPKIGAPIPKYTTPVGRRTASSFSKPTARRKF